MTDTQKVLITDLRGKGYGYKKIAQMTGISENTVKSYCRRNSVPMTTVVDTPSADNEHFCLSCGFPVTQKSGRKNKKFCSDRCRNKWWNTHLDQVKRKAIYEFTCPTCGGPFSAYGNANRKYCSHECYIEDRFGGVHV
jgi:endogenous inhibitor of DNA gyrase (YacG/DUF329 family)